MPMIFIVPLIMTGISYFGMGLSLSVNQVFIFYLTLFLQAFAANSYGYFLSSLFSNPTTCIQLSPSAFIPMYVLGGYYVNPGNFPTWIAWLQYLSPVRYGFEALV